MLPNLDNALRVAFYNVGLLQDAPKSNKQERGQNLINSLVKDVATAFKKHKLQLLLLCELGEHEIGLPSRPQALSMQHAGGAHGDGHGESQWRL